MHEIPTPSTGLIEEECARLCESDALRRAPSHLRLLRYLVDKSLAGDEGALRETAIALEVFRRDPAVYDPQTDPIVRVTIGRLRARLAARRRTRASSDGDGGGYQLRRSSNSKAGMGWSSGEAAESGSASAASHNGGPRAGATLVASCGHPI